MNMKARVISYTETNNKIITGKIDIDIAFKMQEELQSISPFQEHIIYITE